MIKSKQRKTSKKAGIQFKLYVMLAVFTFVIISVVWIFQVFLLSAFYENSKKREILLTADVLTHSIGDTDFSDVVNQYAEQYQICVSVYQIMKMNGFGNIAVPVASADVFNGCLIHNLDGGAKLTELYRGAAAEGGALMKNVSADDFFNLEWMTSRNGFSFPRLSADDAVHKLCVNLVSSGGNEYVILLDSELTPLTAIIHTRNAQFGWITAITLVLAFVMALVMSRSISKPVKKMNEAAKQLAQGKYDVRFDSQGCRELQELGDTLNYAASELSRTDAIQKELIANVSHDLRTPLTMIRGYSEVMRDIPGEATTENIQIIIDETTRLSDLVNDLLDLSKLEAGTREAHPELLNVTTVLREVSDRYSAMLRHAGYEIELQTVPGDDLFAETDRTMLLQILYNLVNNAVNYTGEDKSVKIVQTLENGVMRVSIVDTGEGINPEQLPLIWDRYYKIDRVHRRAMVGTGLGLSIVKQLLELQHCRYGVDSTVGTGSTFWFELTALPAPEVDDSQII